MGVGALAGCLGGDGGEAILVGGLQPYQGPFALYGQAHTAGIEFAFEQVNDAGGALGREILHEGHDTGSDPSEAVTVFTQLVEQEDVVAAVGPVSSDVGVSASESAESFEVPLYLHAAGAISILDLESRYTFRTALPPAPAIVRAVSGHVEQRGYEEIACIVADYEWGHSVRSAIERFFGDAIPIQTAPFDENDFTPYLREMPEDLDVLIGSGHPPGLNDIFRDMTELGIEPDLFTAVVSPPEEHYSALGEAVVRGFTFGHLPDYHSQAYQSVAADFNAATGGFFGPTQAAGYVTGRLIAAGLEEAGEAAPEALAAAMRDISFDTIYQEPIRYTDWGELDQYAMIWSGFELGAPEHHPDGAFDLVEVFRTDPMAAIDPTEW